MIKFHQEVVDKLRAGGIGVIPTDTLYGIVGSAFSKRAVGRIYRVRRRNSKKPLIILIGSFRDLARFGVTPSPSVLAVLHRVWPGKVSVILPCRGRKLYYLHRGTNSLAFRLPKTAWLIRLLRKAGPLVAPSANLEGSSPARTARGAYAYFGNFVDFYLDGGARKGKPSAIVHMLSQRPRVLRGTVPTR